ncbi:MAG: hypothetical protein NXI11_05950 [Proteobacteria bacterium]|nr:hypothetical protein [Pseudomonadota bacterium]
MGQPQVLSLRLFDSRPTHFQTFGDQSALFFDGDTGVASASVAVFNDAGIEAGEMDYIPRTYAQHGAAQVVGNVAFVTRQEDIDSFLPERVDRLERLGGQFRHIETYDVQCPGLHGSASNGGYTAFGCGDGLLLIDRQSNGFPATKVANPASFTGDMRIGRLAAHADVPEMVGIASGHPYLIHPTHGDIEALAGWPEDLGIEAMAFDGHGEHFVALDDAGELHLFTTGQEWTLTHSRAVLGAQDDEDLPAPSLAVSGHDGLAFVTDPVNRLVVVVDLESGEVLESVAVDYVPSGLVWLGGAE